MNTNDFNGDIKDYTLIPVKVHVAEVMEKLYIITECYYDGRKLGKHFENNLSAEKFIYEQKLNHYSDIKLMISEFLELLSIAFIHVGEIKSYKLRSYKTNYEIGCCVLVR